MPFGVVSGVGRGMGVLDGVHVPQGEEDVSGIFCRIGLNGIFFNKWLVHEKLKIFLYVQYNTSLGTSVHWLSKYIVSFKIEVGVYEKFAKM